MKNLFADWTRTLNHDSPPSKCPRLWVRGNPARTGGSRATLAALFSLLTILLVSVNIVWAQSVLATWQDTSSGDAQEDYFVLERRLEPSGSYFDVGHPPQNSQSWADTQVIGGNTYTWRMKAVNSLGASPYSNEATLLVQAAPGSPSIVCLTDPNALPPPAGLVLSFGFNTGSGSTVVDGSGNANNGTISGATWTTSGKFGNALSFNGVNAWVTVPHSSSLNLTTGMTLEAWVYPTTLAGTGDIIVKEGPGSDYYNLYALGGAGQSQGTILVGASTHPIDGPLLAVNTWVHLALTYDGAVERLFVNGVQVASKNITGVIQTSTGVLRMGGNSMWGEYFQGRIDEVRIYNRALTQAEIQADMNSGAP